MAEASYHPKKRAIAKYEASIAESKRKKNDEIRELKSSISVCGFMEYVIYHLMYVKKIYSKEKFTRSQRNGVPFWISNHPEVTKVVWSYLEYADKCLKELKELGMLFSFVKNKVALEEYTFLLKFSDREFKFECEMDSLISICEDISRTNSGISGYALNMMFVVHKDADIPEDDTGKLWLSCPFPITPAYTSEEKPLKTMIPFKDHHIKKYKVSHSFHQQCPL